MNIRVLERKNNQNFVVLLSFGFLCIALFSIAASPLLIRLSEREISPWATAFNRFWLTAIFLGLWNGLQLLFYPSSEESSNQSSVALDASLWVPLISLGTFFSLDLMLWSWSLTQTSVANATLFANLTPLFSTLGAWLLWKKRFDWKFILGMGIALIGGSAVMLNDLALTPEKLIGDVAALLASLCFCIYLLFLEKLQAHLSTTAILFWMSIIATIAALPLVLMHPENCLPVSWIGWCSVIALALVCQIVGQGLLTQSLKHLSSAFVALFLLLDPVVAAIAANVFFKEYLSTINWIEFAVVLVGIAIAFASPAVKQEGYPVAD